MKKGTYRDCLGLEVVRSARSLLPGAFRLLLGASFAGTLLSACASVAPYEKEHLGDPILALDAETAEEAREVKWLEDYHEEVFAKLSPFLNKEEKAWMKEKC